MGIKMRSLSLFLLFFFYVVTAFSASGPAGAFNILNQVEGLEVRIVADTLCDALDFEVEPIITQRWTNELVENPIKYSMEPVNVRWTNCRIAEYRFFAEHNHKDHSKIYITLKDEVTHKTVSLKPMHAKTGLQFKTIEFEGRSIFIALNHFGEYVYSTPDALVYTTTTDLTFLPN